MSAPAAHAEHLSAEHRETLGQALGDAISWRTPPGDCDGCEASPSALCTECAADLDLTDAYIALANELGIEIPGMSAPVTVTGRQRGRSCGYPARRCGAPAEWHNPPAGIRRPWTAHDVPCAVRSTDPALYPACGLVRDHSGDCLFTARPARRTS